MKIILEEKDIIELLGKALGTTLDSTHVIISTNPFEITVTEATKVLKQVDELNKYPDPVSTSPTPVRETTPEEMAELMGLNYEIINVGKSTANPRIDNINTVLRPPPTGEDGNEVF